MQVLTALDDIKTLNKPIAITLGMFDGMHLGHQKIFTKLKELTKHQNGTIIVISFSNHPIELVKPGTIIPKICSLDEKLQLFKLYGADVTLLLKFNEKIKGQTYDQFLKMIKDKIDFDYLVLGEGAKLGKNQEGDQTHVENLSHSLGFKSFYINKMSCNNHIISSQRIREQLKLGQVENLHHLLGRHYSLYAPFQLEKLKETGENLLKITFDFENHCQMPPGHYLVNLKSEQHQTQAVAYLTTLQSEKESKMFDLEIYLSGSKSAYMNDNIKIEFLKMIESPDEVKDDILHNGKIEKLKTDEKSS